MTKKTKVYICKTDFDYHIPHDVHGIRIYFTEEDIRDDMKCTEECGIVEATLEFSKVIQKRKKR